jgi:hypothetical protein
MSASQTPRGLLSPSLCVTAFCATLFLSAPCRSAPVTETWTYNLSSAVNDQNSMWSSIDIRFMYLDPNGPRNAPRIYDRARTRVTATPPAGQPIYMTDGNSIFNFTQDTIIFHITPQQMRSITVAIVFDNMDPRIRITRWMLDRGDLSTRNDSAPLSLNPVPAALPLSATGLGIMGLIARRRNRNSIATNAAA